MLPITNNFLEDIKATNGSSTVPRLDYFSYTRIKRDFLDNRYFDKYKNEYQVLLQLLLESRGLEEREIVQRLENEIINLDWSEKLKVCKELLTEMQHEWVKNYPKSNLTDQKVEDWLYENIYEKVFDYYNEEYNKFEPSEYDPLSIFKKVGKTLKEKIYRINIMIEFNIKSSIKVSSLHWSNFSNGDWLKIIKSEANLVSNENIEEFVILLSGHFRAESFGEFNTPKGNIYITKINQLGEYESTDEVFNKDTLADAIMKISVSKPKKKIKLNYAGSPDRLIHGFTKYNDIYWRIDNVESFVCEYFLFTNEKYEGNSTSTFETISGYKYAIAVVIRELKELKYLCNKPHEMNSWLKFLLKLPSESTTIYAYINKNRQGYYDQSVSRVNIDINTFK